MLDLPFGSSDFQVKFRSFESIFNFRRTDQEHHSRIAFDQGMGKVASCVLTINKNKKKKSRERTINETNIIITQKVGKIFN